LTPFDAPVEEDEAPSNMPQHVVRGNLPMVAVWILLLIGGSIFRLCN
jgi:hypothetical protein